MKKLLAAVLMSALLLNVGTISSFASGTGHHRNAAKTCRNNTYTCIQNDCSFTDADGDGICDNCGTQNCKNACEAYTSDNCTKNTRSNYYTGSGTHHGNGHSSCRR